MRLSYLLLVCVGNHPSDQDVNEFCSRTDLSLRHHEGNVFLFTNDPDDIISVANGRGFVIGKLFRDRGQGHQLKVLSYGDEVEVMESEGRRLVNEFWGSFVALVISQNGINIVRDPSGGLPCYWSQTDRLIAFSSDAETLVDWGAVGRSVNWASVGRFLYHHQLPSECTAVEGIMQLLPGSALSIVGSRVAATPLWSPWNHIEPNGASEPSPDRLFTVLQSTFSAWRSAFNRPLVGLSGGLDSSIVAACLAGARSDFVCTTLTTSDTTGNETEYARAVSAVLGAELVEMPYMDRHIDLDRSVAEGIPFPCGKSHEQAYNHAIREAASINKADAFFVGAGGDNVFYLTHSARPLADRFRKEGLSLGVMKTLRDICEVTGAGVGQTLIETVRLLSSRSMKMRWSAVSDYLHPDVIASERSRAVEHPWLSPPRNAPLAKLGHVAMILQAMNHVEHRDKQLAMPMISPLLSQPVVELCLSIPSWEFCEDGVDRSVARRAFASVLPREVIARVGKGSPDGFIAQFIDRHRSEIIDRLCEGRLVKHGIIDRLAIEPLRRSNSRNGLNDCPRIMALLDAEAWSTHWSRA
ncbi:asparagine synthetase B family protein [Sphingopyxis sp. DBS4]|uniref:asparagine synthase-related protein n=1 Tax=Sphingopyxis sp. DBS4 TaxID=2968500 RepID=UPI00214C447A|nr:asparagine synthetase B family protein [Sphingopyxis sp. DBS4]